MSKKMAIVVMLISLVWLNYSKLEPPKGVESLNYKMNFIISRSFGFIAHAASRFNFGFEPTNFRHLIDGLFSKVIKPKENTSIKTTDTTINGVRVRIYKPTSLIDKKDLPVIIFYHGGAYVLGNLEMYHEYVGEMARKSNSVLISVDYRLAPEYPFPTPTDDCYAVTKYVLESKNEFGDTDRVILAGDSAGGNAVAVLTQRLLAEGVKQPKLQVLIYPWTQMINIRIPSYQYVNYLGFQFGKYIGWYLGLNEVSEELQSLIENNNHTLLIDDKKTLEKYKSYTDHNLIPRKYKDGKKFYETYDIIKSDIFPKSLHSASLLKKDKKIASLLKKVFSPEFSPGLAEPERLKGLPQALFISCEFDPIKDEGLIYSERLKKAGVKVDVQFYENCFHGGLQVIDELIGFQISRIMLDNLTEFITKNV